MKKIETPELILARNLRDRRTYLSLSQQQLAKKIGKNQQFISRIEKNGHVFATDFYRLASALKTKPESLLTKMN